MKSSNPAARRFRLLVVEDDPQTLGLLRSVLEGSGIEVRGAGRLAEGLGMATRERPDLVLMDLDLPDGSGLTAIEDLRRDPMTEGIPVIAFSGLDAETYRPRAIAAGCADYVSKPFKIYDLALRLQRWLPA